MAIVPSVAQWLLTIIAQTSPLRRAGSALGPARFSATLDCSPNTRAYHACQVPLSASPDHIRMSRTPFNVAVQVACPYSVPSIRLSILWNLSEAAPLLSTPTQANPYPWASALIRFDGDAAARGSLHSNKTSSAYSRRPADSRLLRLVLSNVWRNLGEVTTDANSVLPTVRSQ